MMHGPVNLRLTVKGFKSAVCPVLWMGILGISVRKVKALIVKMERATLIANGR